MGSLEKRLEEIRKNPKDVTFAELDTLLRHYGCQVRQRRRGSSHHVYHHPLLPRHLTIPNTRPLKPIYVKRALAMIDDIREVIGDGA